jgi:hypothetical protein
MKKKLLIVLGLVVVLLVAAWFVVTSPGFVKSAVLPRVGAALGSDLKVEGLAFSPFSRLELRRLEVTPRGAETLLTADLVRVRYRLGAILGGRLALDEVLVEAPKVTVIRRPDGTSNLDPVLQAAAGDPAAKPAPRSGAAPQIALAMLRLNNGALTCRATDRAGVETRVEVTALNLSADNLANGASGKLANGAVLSFAQGPAGGAPTNTFGAQLKGAFDLALTADLLPASLSGSQRLELLRGAGAFAGFAGFVADLGADLTPTELKSAGVQFTKGGAALGGLSARGPLDLAKKEGRVQFELQGVDRNVLNLAGAALGLDFAGTQLAGQGALTLADAGRKLAATGRFTGTQVGVKQGALATPPVDMRADFDLAVDQAAQAATVNALNLAATQGGREFLTGTLSRPMQISYGGAAGAPDADFKLAVKELRLADWAALLGSQLGGTLNAAADLGVQNGGRDLALKADATLAGVSGRLGAQPLSNLGARLTADAKLAAFADPAQRALVAQAKVADTRGETGLVRLDGLTAAADLDLGLPAGKYIFRRAALQLDPTPRAQNALNLTGEVELTRPGAIGGALRLAAESLDLTRHYDLLKGDTKPAEQAPATPPPGPQTEPPAMTLPFGTFTVDAAIGRLFLRELAASNVVAKVVIAGSRVTAAPATLTLNGAPVAAAARLNLGVPGYEYDVQLKADGVPVAPLANSFVPLLTGRIAGQVMAHAEVKGAGLTGASLKQSLAGQLGFAVTNANLSLTDPNAKRGPLTVLLDLLRAGLRIPEITTQPIMQIMADAKLGGGKIDLTRAYAGSAALEVETRGGVTIADDLMQSPVSLPVELRLGRNLADRAMLTPANTPTNVAFVPLPPLASVGGTLGQIQPNVDRAQVGLLAARGIAGLAGGSAGGLVEAAGELVNDPGRAVGNVLGGLLGGGQRGATNAAATNAAPADPLGGALRGLFGPKKKQ